MISGDLLGCCTGYVDVLNWWSCCPWMISNWQGIFFLGYQGYIYDPSPEWSQTTSPCFFSPRWEKYIEIHFDGQSKVILVWFLTENLTLSFQRRKSLWVVTAMAGHLADCHGAGRCAQRVDGGKCDMATSNLQLWMVWRSTNISLISLKNPGNSSWKTNFQVLRKS